MILKPFDVCGQLLGPGKVIPDPSTSHVKASACSPHPCKGEPLGMPSAIFLGLSPLRVNQGAEGQEMLGTLLVFPLKAEGRESFLQEEVSGSRRTQIKRRDNMLCDTDMDCRGQPRVGGGSIVGHCMWEGSVAVPTDV